MKCRIYLDAELVYDFEVHASPIRRGKRPCLGRPEHNKRTEAKQRAGETGKGRERRTEEGSTGQRAWRGCPGLWRPRARGLQQGRRVEITCRARLACPSECCECAGKDRAGQERGPSGPLSGDSTMLVADAPPVSPSTLTPQCSPAVR